MANIFKIKRGNGAPAKGILKDGELGLDKIEKKFYMGMPNGVSQPVGGNSIFYQQVSIEPKDWVSNMGELEYAVRAQQLETSPWITPTGDNLSSSSFYDSKVYVKRVNSAAIILGAASRPSSRIALTVFYGK